MLTFNSPVLWTIVEAISQMYCAFEIRRLWLQRIYPLTPTAVSLQCIILRLVYFKLCASHPILLFSSCIGLAEISRTVEQCILRHRIHFFSQLPHLPIFLIGGTAGLGTVPWVGAEHGGDEWRGVIGLTFERILPTISGVIIYFFIFVFVDFLLIHN